ncbi:MAG: 1-phosphofructokinase [Spirochaetia bacterium]
MDKHYEIVTVTMNPAIDETIYIYDFVPGSVNRVEKFVRNAGGKGINIASFLADFGLPVLSTGFLGDANSVLFEEFFREKQIEDGFIRIDGHTRTDIKIIDEKRIQTTDINYPGLEPEEKDIHSLKKRILSHAEKDLWVVLSGSIPKNADDSIYAQLCRELKKEGCKVALDTSGDALRKAIEEEPDLVKPNVKELEEFSGKTLHNVKQVALAAEKLTKMGISYVVVSMGAEGAMFMYDGEKIVAHPPEIDAVSTVGAGDAMMAGMIAASVKGWNIHDSAKLATAFAAAAVTRIGSGLPPEATIQKWMEEIKIENVSDY